MNNIHTKLIIILIFILIILCDINYAYYILDNSYTYNISNTFINNTNNTNNTNNSTNISTYLYSNDHKPSLIIIVTIIFISGILSGIWEYC
jgi:hypothetical protein